MNVQDACVHIGERQKVLVTEESFDSKFYVAHNRFYEQVLVPKSPAFMGKMVEVDIFEAGKHFMRGQPVLDASVFTPSITRPLAKGEVSGLTEYRLYPSNKDSLPELTEIVSDLVLRTPRMLVLGDFNLHAETGLTGAAQDFMASMTAMGLSQHVTGPTHERGHTLDLVFSTGQEEGGLRVRNLCLTPLSWSDHFLVRFVLESGLSLCKGADPFVWVHSRSQVDPDGFLKALGEFPADKTGAPVEALVELWNGEMARAVDTIAPKRPLLPGRAHSSPWFTPELRVMKRVERQLEHRWRKSRDESD
ncbi:Threonylcarbamoyladenosine tRNA methylthiotransferase [Varanus komodoensis]|nr:Threonylcarbamoyladenosine tRNA methylthiotransferase [Varanus komodoensis]